MYYQVQKQVEDTEPLWKPRIDPASLPRPKRSEAQEP